VRVVAWKGLKRERTMSNIDEPTYRLSEIVGTSSESVHQAVRNGLKRASQTIRNLDWFEVTQVRGTVVDGQVGHFQVAMKVGFRVEE
jgi:flavin-binding protein dodecin